MCLIVYWSTCGTMQISQCFSRAQAEAKLWVAVLQAMQVNRQKAKLGKTLVLKETFPSVAACRWWCGEGKNMWSVNYRLYHNVYLTKDRINMCEELVSGSVAYLVASISTCLSLFLVHLSACVPSPNFPSLFCGGFSFCLPPCFFKPSCPAAQGNLPKACFAWFSSALLQAWQRKST